MKQLYLQDILIQKLCPLVFVQHLQHQCLDFLLGAGAESELCLCALQLVLKQKHERNSVGNFIDFLKAEIGGVPAHIVHGKFAAQHLGVVGQQGEMIQVGRKDKCFAGGYSVRGAFDLVDGFTAHYIPDLVVIVGMQQLARLFGRFQHE